MLIVILSFDQMQHEVDISLSQRCELSKLRYVTWEIGGKNKEHSLCFELFMAINTSTCASFYAYIGWL